MLLTEEGLGQADIGERDFRVQAEVSYSSSVQNASHGSAQPQGILVSSPFACSGGKQDGFGEHMPLFNCF